MATDGCEDGYWVVSGEFPPSVVSPFGASSLPLHVQQYKGVSALSDLDPFRAAETVEDLSGECEDDSSEEIALPDLRERPLNASRRRREWAEGRRFFQGAGRVRQRRGRRRRRHQLWDSQSG